MMSAASRTSETIKQTSRTREAGGGVSILGFGGKAATSFGFTTSTGVARVGSRAAGMEATDESETGVQQYYGAEDTSVVSYESPLFVRSVPTGKYLVGCRAHISGGGTQSI